jgi:hypothetical protein
MSRILSLFVLALLVGLGSCKKDEIDLASLNTNPFDADYVGTPIFTFVSATTTSGVVNGVPVNILNVDVQVHTELFGRQTPYIVRTVNSNTGAETMITSGSMVDDRFTVRANGVQPGAVHCWNLQVGNANSFGGGNQVCGTAE